MPNKNKTSTKTGISKVKDRKQSKAKDLVMKVAEENEALSSSQNSLLKLANTLSGEHKLRAQEARLTELKEKNIARREMLRKETLRDGIESRVIDLEEVDYLPRKVIQNIKLFSWTSAVRVRFQYDSKVFLGLVAFTLVFILYLAFLGHYALMGVMIALVFFIYVAGVTDPVITDHSITARGVESFGKLYEWCLLDEFRFTIKNDSTLLIMETKLRFPARLIMLTDPKDIKAIFVLLQDKVIYSDIRKQGFIDKLTFGEYIPLDKI